MREFVNFTSMSGSYCAPGLVVGADAKPENKVNASLCRCTAARETESK